MERRDSRGGLPRLALPLAMPQPSEERAVLSPHRPALRKPQPGPWESLGAQGSLSLAVCPRNQGLGDTTSVVPSCYKLLLFLPLMILCVRLCCCSRPGLYVQGGFLYGSCELRRQFRGLRACMSLCSDLCQGLLYCLP